MKPFLNNGYRGMNYEKLKLPFVLALLGYIFSARPWILFLNTLNPFVGLLVYYMIMTSALLILQFFGLIIAGIKFDSLCHTVGTILIIFSFFVIVDWESCYIQIVTKNEPCTSVSGVYNQSEDGATWYVWSQILGDNRVELIRIMTYVMTPFVLTMIGQMLITSKITISPF